MNDQVESILGELVLRIRGTSRRGELLRLRSPKCTIGSGQHCTLRLGAKLAEPLNCLILRSEGNTIVRCSASNTRLNGQSFSEAQLSPGDVLGIGTLEFEVVSLNEGAKPADREPGVPSPSMTHKGESQKDRSLPEEVPTEKGRELDALKATLKVEKAALDLRNFQINQEVAALEQEKACFEREKEAFLFEKNCFEVERQNWRIEQKELVSRQEAALAVKSAEESDQIQRQLMELESKRRVLEEVSERHQAEWEATQRQHEVRVRQLDEREAALYAQSANMTGTIEQSKTAAAEMDRRSRELDAQKANLDERAEQLRQAVTDAENRSAGLDGRAAELNRQSAEIDRREKELASSAQERDDLQKERTEFLREMEAFQKTRERFEQERLYYQQDQEHFRQLRGELERERALFQQERGRLELERQHWEAQRTAAARAETEAELHEEHDPNDATDAQYGQKEDSGEPAVDLREILHRLGHNVEFPEDEAGEQQAASAESAREFGASRPAKRNLSDAASSAAAEEKEEEDEESVDSYMAQLMQRLGVQASEPSGAGQKVERNLAPKKAVEDNASRRKASEVESPPENSRPRREPAALSPRAVAPEKNVDISALRDLANLSAKHALGRHDLKQLIRATQSKLMVTLLSLAVGVGLLWHWSAHNTGKLIVFSAGLSFMIALYWGLQYAVLTGRLIINRSGGIVLRKHRGSSKASAAQNKTSNKSGETKEQDDKQDADQKTNAPESANNAGV